MEFFVLFGEVLTMSKIEFVLRRLLQSSGNVDPLGGTTSQLVDQAITEYEIAKLRILQSDPGAVVNRLDS